MDNQVVLLLHSTNHAFSRPLQFLPYVSLPPQVGLQSPPAARGDLQQESFGANPNLALLSASSLSIACEKSAQDNERYDRQELTPSHGPKVHDKLRETDSPESSWLGLEADIDFRFECAVNGTLRGDLHELGMLLRCYCTGQLHIELDPIEHSGLR